MNLYPMKTEPIPGETTWGGNRMFQKFGWGDGKNKIGECMLLSGNSHLADGSLKGLTVNQVAARYPTEFSGRDLKMFPHALKLVDTQYAVPPKIHSDRHGIGGAWNHYEIILVLDAQPGAGLYAGLRDQLTAEQFKEKAEQKQIKSAMHFLRAHTGDVFLIPAGLLHALGGGILALVLSMGVDEQYKTSDTEHTAVFEDLRPNVRCLKCSGSRQEEPWGETTDIRMEGYIHMRKIHLKGKADFEIGEEAAALFISSGSGQITSGDESAVYQAGDTFVFAAENTSFTVEGEAEGIIFG